MTTHKRILLRCFFFVKIGQLFLPEHSFAGENSATLKLVSAGYANSAGLQCQRLFFFAIFGQRLVNANFRQGLVNAIFGQAVLGRAILRHAIVRHAVCRLAVLWQFFGKAIPWHCAMFTAKRQRQGLWSCCRCGVGDI